MPQIDTPARLPASNAHPGEESNCSGSLSARSLAITTEVPSYEHARIHGESDLNAFRDGRRVLRTIITEWHNR